MTNATDKGGGGGGAGKTGRFHAKLHNNFDKCVNKKKNHGLNISRSISKLRH